MTPQPSGSPSLRLVLVVPCFNEARRLDRGAFGEWVDRRPGTRLLFVDDGSTDATTELLGALHADHPDRIQALSLDQNRGKGEAVRRGIRLAMEWSPEFIGFWDADLATPLDEVDSLLHELESRAGVEWVLASRVRLLGRSIDRRPWRHYFGRVFATLVSLGLKLPVYDTQCGAKIFRNTDLLDRVTETPFVTRWLFDVELLARMIQAQPGGSAAAAEVIYECPISTWRDVGQSTLTLPQYVRAMTSLLAIAREYGVHPKPSPPPKREYDRSRA